MSRFDTGHVLLRLGVAFAFLYPPIAALSDPDSWYGYFPRFIQSLPLSESVLLHGFGIIEIVIALWILSGKNILIPSTLATLMLLGIVAFNIPLMDVVFRDLSIAAMSASLSYTAWENRNLVSV
jgi:hypothetical protein